ncbi:NAD(P)/FAD-dependent oxidoreductase [Candidatus Caldatribacterium sp.]|uniref:NAD(P)/FAD-dependent oxidoreductase n=1 Tax=Candidatus Caldatribacterium sp. TaxID=2282143 RepID=UPI0029944BD8|nr:NAD(P)/FAD-dependent oxidoreductase [Candidatus Caldatribacterium sp.]MDW8080565.1 FAD-dependent oxidoreductase [Candidatus Calescibacterium sp.]
MPKSIEADVVVVGGGPAGMAAAISSWEHGARGVFLLERNPFLGGILNQCIHPGFGLHVFGEELTGPEYAERYIELLQKTGVEVLTDTTVLEVRSDRTVIAVSRRGVFAFHPRAVVFAVGCRERTRGMIRLPGTRPSGIFTAGCAQYLVNVEGYLPGRRAVILGSGDIGLIMARRLTLEGVRVEAVVEIRPTLSGLLRNYVQCVQDFGIPLLLSHTVFEVFGKERVEGVLVGEVDEKGKPKGEPRRILCDTLLLSVGLIPESELLKKAGVPLCPSSNGPFVDEDFACDVPGFFACGNVVAVFDLVDYVTKSAERIGQRISERFEDKASPLILSPGRGVATLVPQRIRRGKEGFIYVRPKESFRKARLSFVQQGQEFYSVHIPICRPGEMIRLELSQIPWPRERKEVQVILEGERHTDSF